MSAPAAKVQVDTPEEQSERTPRRAALASWVGSALEYYDFAVYGTAAALVLNTLFFPEETSAGVSVLLAMGTVGVAYIVRPFGALIMGPLADRLGRRFVLMLTLFMMGGATFAIGFFAHVCSSRHVGPGPTGALPDDSRTLCSRRTSFSHRRVT